MFTTENTERTEFKKRGFLSDLGELIGYKKVNCDVYHRGHGAHGVKKSGFLSGLGELSGNKGF